MQSEAEFELTKAKEDQFNSESAKGLADKNLSDSQERLGNIKRKITSIQQEEKDLAAWKAVITEALPLLKRMNNSVKVSAMEIGIGEFLKDRISAF